MARARNIKPGFFLNDELSDIEPIGRLLFIGMWTIADFKGDIVWREKRIKAQLLPYDNVDIKKIAINLDKSGFIRFYSDGEKTYLNVVNFNRHQVPHKNERDKGSDIPVMTEAYRQAIDLEGLAINRDKSRSIRNSSASDRADSLILNPSSRVKDYVEQEETCPTDAELLAENIELIFDFWRTTLKHPKAKLDDKRTRIIKRALNKFSVDCLRLAIVGCSKTPHNIGQNDTKQVFDGFHIIFKDAENIERFIRNSENTVSENATNSGISKAGQKRNHHATISDGIKQQHNEAIAEAVANGTLR